MTSTAAVTAATATATSPNAAAAAGAPSGADAKATAATDAAATASAPAGTAPPADKGSILDQGSKTDPAKDTKAGNKKPDDKAAASEDKPFDTKVLKLPEGFEVHKELMGKFGEFATTAKLSPEQAQAQVDFFQTNIAPMLAQAQKAPYEAWDTLKGNWQAEIKADPVVGGPKLEASINGIVKMIDAVGGENAKEIRQALKITGAADNPAIFKLLTKLSQAMNEGGQIKAGSPATPPKSAAQTLYPNQGKD